VNALPILGAYLAAAGPPPAVAETVVRSLYPMVSFAANTEPDWDRVRGLFIKQAVVTLRTSRTTTSVFDVEGFINDFVKFAARPAVRAAGFRERVVRLKATEYGAIAHVLVLYEAEVLGVTKPAQRGVDSFHLLRRNGEWKIVSIINEVVTPARPLPPELRDEKETGPMPG